MAHPDGGQGNSFQTECSFDQAYSFVRANEPYRFQSTTNKDVVARTGQTENGERAIMFPGHGNICPACWGYRLNCSGARVGHCVEAISRHIGGLDLS
mgnify:CR=1 FL=1